MLKEEPIGYYYNQFEEVLNKLTFEKDSKFTYLSKLENVFAIFAIIDLFCSTIIFKILYNKIDQFLFLKNLGEVKKKEKKINHFFTTKKKKIKKKIITVGIVCYSCCKVVKWGCWYCQRQKQKNKWIKFFHIFIFAQHGFRWRCWSCFLPRF